MSLRKMPKKRDKEWMAIVVFPFSNGARPIAIQSEDLEEIALFDSQKEIENLMMRHPLGAGNWYAFNFVDGQMEML